MATQLKTLSSVTTTSVAVQISSVLTRAPAVTIAAAPTNTITLWVGDSDVASNRGIPLNASQTLTITCPQYGGSDDDVFLSDLYVYATASAQVASVVYFARRHT